MVTKVLITLLKKQFKLDKILKYVEEDNELDKEVVGMGKRIDMLEKVAHPKREFVVCNKCKRAIEQYEGTD